MDIKRSNLIRIIITIISVVIVAFVLGASEKNVVDKEQKLTSLPTVILLSALILGFGLTVLFLRRIIMRKLGSVQRELDTLNRLKSIDDALALLGARSRLNINREETESKEIMKALKGILELERDLGLVRGEKFDELLIKINLEVNKTNFSDKDEVDSDDSLELLNADWERLKHFLSDKLPTIVEGLKRRNELAREILRTSKRTAWPGMLERLVIWIEEIVKVLKTDDSFNVGENEESTGGKTVNDPVENRQSKEITPTEMLKSIKESIEKIMEFREVADPSHGEKIKDLVSKIKNTGIEIVDTLKNSSPLYLKKFPMEKLEMILDFLTEDLPGIVEDIKWKNRQLCERNQLAGKINFLEERARKMAGLHDAVYIANSSISMLIDSLDKRWADLNLKNYKVLSYKLKGIVKKFQNAFLNIPKDDKNMEKNTFDMKIEAFNECLGSFVNELKKKLEENCSPDEQEHLDGLEKLINDEYCIVKKLIDSLAADRTLYSDLVDDLKIVSAQLKKGAVDLDCDLKTAQGLNGRCERNIEGLNESQARLTTNVNKLLEIKNAVDDSIKRMENQCELLGTEAKEINLNANALTNIKQEIDFVAKSLEKQNDEGKIVKNVIDVSCETLKNKTESLNAVVECLTNHSLCDKEFSETLRTKTDKLNIQAQAISDVVAQLGEKNSENVINCGKLSNVLESMIERNTKINDDRIELTNQNHEARENNKELFQLMEKVKGVVSDLEIWNEKGRNINSMLNVQAGNLVTKLDEKVSKVERVSEIILDRNKKTDNLVKDLNEETEKLKKQIIGLKSVTANLNNQNDRNETIGTGFDDRLLELEKGVEKIEKQSRSIIDHLEQVSGNSVAFEANLKSLGKCITTIQKLEEEITRQSELDQTITYGLKENFKTLSDVLQNFQQTATAQEKKNRSTVDDINKKLKDFVEEQAGKASGDQNTKLLINYINEELKLKITAKDAVEVISKLEGEPPVSKNYRLISVNLLLDLLELKKIHGHHRLWEFIRPLYNKLDESMLALRNREGQTIYDAIFTGMPSLKGLRSITEKEICHLINQQHWGDFWDPLLRGSDFLNVYFRDELPDLCNTLEYSARKVEGFLKKLGYKIERLKPLQFIPAEHLQRMTVEEMSNHFEFRDSILPNIKKLPSFIQAQARYDEATDQKLILYVEKNGLIVGGKRIQTAKIVSYSPLNM